LANIVEAADGLPVEVAYINSPNVSAVIAPIFPCQPVFSHFAFSRVIWTLNYTTKILLLYHLFSTLSGEAIGIKQG